MKILFGLLGGLALFLYGMEMMSRNLQRAAGERMHRILQVCTKSPLGGILAGALTAAVLQSSSAAIVMTIGFVSAGLMTMPQAFAVVMGANLGTTMTAQLLAFSFGDYIGAAVFAGFLLSRAARGQTLRAAGRALLGFGLLFVGIGAMEGAMKPLADSDGFRALIGAVKDRPLLGLLVGTGMTLIAQSSSATIAVLQNFASQAGAGGTGSLLGLAGAIPIMLGDNIGTTVTALLACIGRGTQARRTALAHSLFNLSGSVLFLFFVEPFARFVELVSVKGPQTQVIARQIANAHTLFNAASVLLWLPFIGVMVRLVEWLAPDRPPEPSGCRKRKYSRSD